MDILQGVYLSSYIPQGQIQDLDKGGSGQDGCQRHALLGGGGGPGECSPGRVRNVDVVSCIL